MPGIVAFTSEAVQGDQANQTKTLRNMREMITHGDFYVTEALFHDERFWATASSTGILQKGPQPYSRDGLHVWLDGEFYNQDQLPAGCDDHGDPAILHGLYVKDPAFEFLKRIDGYFAAVIYDSTKRQVHLLADRYGFKHLFWMRRGGGLVLASEMKAMLAVPGFEPKIEKKAVEDFFSDFNHLTETYTWFEGVRLLPTGSVLTWDLDRRDYTVKKVWAWDHIKVMTGRIDRREIAEELGRRFVRAVERRSPAGQRVGATLSGGLDSRAIVAAMPQRPEGLDLVTFGMQYSDDIELARRVAKLKGARHHVFEITADNWLSPRNDGVWWTDGQTNLLHMHNMAPLRREREFLDVNLDGFMGGPGLGGVHLKHSEHRETWRFENGTRRSVIIGARNSEVSTPQRFPFADNHLIDLALSVPPELRIHSRLYNKMLLLTFPEYYRRLPSLTSAYGVRVLAGWPFWFIRTFRFLKRVKDKGKLMMGLPFGQGRMAHYAAWIRQEPGRSFFLKLLKDPKALYPQYIPQRTVHERLESHLSSRTSDEIMICAYATFEIWLRQVFAGQFRPAKLRASDADSGPSQVK